MSFVTFPQRSSISGAVQSWAKTSRVRVHQSFQNITCETLLVVQEASIMQGRAFLCGRHGGKWSKWPTLADQRVFHKTMLKFGIQKSIRKNVQTLTGVEHHLKIHRYPRKRGLSSLPVKLLDELSLRLQPDTAIVSNECGYAYITGAAADNQESPAIRFSDDPFVEWKFCHVSSMSRRRLASNLPTLQRHLAFNLQQCTAQNRSTDTHSWDLFPAGHCSTPITPLDKIMHTPPYPPSLPRHDTRNTLATTASRTPENPITSSLSPQYPTSNKVLCKVSENIRRRLSVVAPPEARPMHAPRRLSYSHTYGKPRSPLTRRTAPTSSEILNTCTETDLLASPLVILPSSHKQSVGWTGNSGYRSEPSFHSVGSPLTVKV